MKKLLGLPVLMLSLSLMLSACSDDDDDDEPMPVSVSYQVEVYNISNNQPLTPLAVVLHGADYSPWSLASAASAGLEQLAEGGDPSAFIAEADAAADVYATATGEGVFTPGASSQVMISAQQHSDMRLSLATMLANTNDAFTGVAKLDIRDLAMGESKSMMLKVMDAGTEDNSEATGTIPGPADMGTGYESARDDMLDKVRIHAGVLSVDEGLSSSVLNESHRWNGPVAKVVVTRM